jgi:hypothetical protein
VIIPAADKATKLDFNILCLFMDVPQLTSPGGGPQQAMAAIQQDFAAQSN